MSSFNPVERQLVARLAAHQSWANTQNRTSRTAPARDAFLAKFEDQVDPRRELSPAERARRSASARKAYFTRLALKSAQSRRGTSDRQAALDELTEAACLISFAGELGDEKFGLSETDNAPEGISTSLRVEKSGGAVR